MLDKRGGTGRLEGQKQPTHSTEGATARALEGRQSDRDDPDRSAQGHLFCASVHGLARDADRQHAAVPSGPRQPGQRIDILFVNFLSCPGVISS